MYYHCRELKYVQYGKVFPPPINVIDDFLLKAYEWLGKYCGYNPQIWLSRSHSNITGFRAVKKAKKSKLFGNRRNYGPSILFGFDIIKGFPVDFETWCFILNAIISKDTSLTEYFKKLISSYIEDGENYKEDPIIKKWSECSSEQEFLQKNLFIETDQFVVPSLNLKVAKKIICRNEKEKKILRNMGFINDRIQIRNDKFWDL